MNRSRLLQSALAVLASAVLLHAKTNPFQRGWCTYQAAETFNRFAPEPGVEWTRDAVRWVTDARAKGWATTTRPADIVPGSVLVWSSTRQNAGHVAGVILVTPTSVKIEEMNFGASDPKAKDPLQTVNFNKLTNRDFKLSGNAAPFDTSSLRFVGAILPWKTDEWHVTQAQTDLRSIVNANNLGTLSAKPTETLRSLRPGWTVRTFEAVRVRTVLGVSFRTTTLVQHAVRNSNLTEREVRWKQSSTRWSAWQRAR